MSADNGKGRSATLLKAGKVRVIVRCRPPLSYEEGHTTDRISVRDNCVLIQDTTKNDEAMQFSFDAVLSPEIDQTETFAEVSPLVDHVLDGFHATIFAYGQTGSGKTHTMEGTRYVQNSKGAIVPDIERTPTSDHGILLRSIQLLFDRAHARQGGQELDEEPTAEADPEGTATYSCDEQYKFKCSYLQIYNEKITDLLNSSNSSKSKGASDSPGLNVQWCHGDFFKVQNLIKWECDSAQSMRDALFRGIKQKVISSHAMNLQSSRSHCIFTIEVECRNTRSGRVVRRSEFSFVDLAGSEKISLLAANPSSKMIKESININTSLLALGKVITALSEKKKKKGKLPTHVPYRDSKLTKLLKHALGGNSFTVMIACINPSDNFVEETMSTLLYAGRAKNIENVPHVNEDSNAALIRALRREIDQLKKELAFYQSMAGENVSHTMQTVISSGSSTGNVSGQARKEVGDRWASPSSSSPSTALTRPMSSPPGRVAPTRSEDGKEHSMTQRSQTSNQQTDQLADSLLSACAMLQQILQVNGKLREAYDAVSEAREASEQREVQLNAENISLRERIELLESIVMNDKFIDAVDRQEEEEDEYADSTTEAQEDSEVSAEEGSDTDGLDRKTGDENYKRDLVSTPSTQSITSSTNVSKRNKVDREHIKNESERQISASGRANDSQPPEKKVQRKKEKKPKKSKKKKRKGKLKDKLKEYESRYNASHIGDSYEAYYASAQGAIPQNKKAQKAADEVATLLQKLPKNIIDEFVPVSVIKPKAFGQLKLCGPPAEVKAFESRKKEMESRRDELMRRQQELRDNIMRDLAIAEMGGEAYLRKQAGEIAAADVRASEGQFNSTNTGRGENKSDLSKMYSPYGNTFSGGAISIARQNRPRSIPPELSARDKQIFAQSARSTDTKGSLSSMEKLKRYLDSQ